VRPSRGRWSTLIGYEAFLRAAAQFLPAAAGAARSGGSVGTSPQPAAAEMLVNVVADALHAVATRVKSCTNPTSLLWIAAEMHFVNSAAVALSPSALPPPRGAAAVKLVTAMRAVMATGVVQSEEYGLHAAAMAASQDAMTAAAAARGSGNAQAQAQGAHDPAGCGSGAGCAACAGLRRHSALCALAGCVATARADGGGGGRLQLCGGCRVAAYCGAAHQRADWKRHKKECSGAFAAQASKMMMQNALVCHVMPRVK
jgi:hypothetical protein